LTSGCPPSRSPCPAPGALVWIGAFIAVIEQLANSLGCALQLPLLIVGIVVVAAGTTVPDTWASIVAARHDADADAAIANAFGSCAVNVFLGLGLPWTVASIYQASRGVPFEAPAGDLAFSVLLFCGLAAGAVLLLLAKRVWRGGELGGPTAVDKFGTAALLFACWVTYVSVSGARAVALDQAEKRAG
jgi:solute carrier family 8 (sodium/calcium exchanger)